MRENSPIEMTQNASKGGSRRRLRAANEYKRAGESCGDFFHWTVHGAESDGEPRFSHP
jgi:hypothetical protein